MSAESKFDAMRQAAVLEVVSDIFSEMLENLVLKERFEDVSGCASKIGTFFRWARSTNVFCRSAPYIAMRRGRKERRRIKAASKSIRPRRQRPRRKNSR